MALPAISLYTKDLCCSTAVESAFYLPRSRNDYVCVNCGSKDYDKQNFKKLCLEYKTVFPTCVAGKVKTKGKLNENKDNEKRENVKENVEKIILFDGNSTVSEDKWHFQVDYCRINIESTDNPAPKKRQMTMVYCTQKKAQGHQHSVVINVSNVRKRPRGTHRN